MEKLETLARIFNNYLSNIDVKYFEIDRGILYKVYRLYNPPHKKSILSNFLGEFQHAVLISGFQENTFNKEIQSMETELKLNSYKNRLTITIDKPKGAEFIENDKR